MNWLKIGSGGMAVVYKARRLVLKRWVAIKILKDEFINDEEFLERFERKYAAGSLNHPNIVSIYDVGRENNIYYIVINMLIIQSWDISGKTGGFHGLKQ